MANLKSEIEEAVSTLRSARAKERAAQFIEAAAEAASEQKEKGQLRISFSAKEKWALEGGRLKRLDPKAKPGKTPVLLDATVDGERFEAAALSARSVQELAFQSGMLIKGSSPFIVAASAAINKRCFPNTRSR